LIRSVALGVNVCGSVSVPFVWEAVVTTSAARAGAAKQAAATAAPAATHVKRWILVFIPTPPEVIVDRMRNRSGSTETFIIHATPKPAKRKISKNAFAIGDGTDAGLTSSEYSQHARRTALGTAAPARPAA
jgi:hypothetical protein